MSYFEAIYDQCSLVIKKPFLSISWFPCIHTDEMGVISVLVLTE